VNEADALEAVGFRREVVAAVEIGQRALVRAKGSLGSPASVKDGRDVVTRADVEVEELISDALGSPVVGEEHGGEAPIDGRAYWLVDPICGTRNYASGIPLYCVNIALVEGDEVVAGVVADASTDEIIVAERGRGTWKCTHGQVQRVTASETSHTIVIEDGRSSGARREHVAALVAAVIRADRWDFRSFGTTLSLPYLATGRISAYIVASTSAPVHTAAGSLLASEAGCLLSDLDGNRWVPGSPTLLAAATPDLHGELLALALANRP
jgi:myo-inositol-1(or 4)-monophosphatase